MRPHSSTVEHSVVNRKTGDRHSVGSPSLKEQYGTIKNMLYIYDQEIRHGAAHVAVEKEMEENWSKKRRA